MLRAVYWLRQHAGDAGKGRRRKQPGGMRTHLPIVAGIDWVSCRQGELGSTHAPSGYQRLGLYQIFASGLETSWSGRRFGRGLGWKRVKLLMLSEQRCMPLEQFSKVLNLFYRVLFAQ